jgi:hypothetical protein
VRVAARAAPGREPPGLAGRAEEQRARAPAGLPSEAAPDDDDGAADPRAAAPRAPAVVVPAPVAAAVLAPPPADLADAAAAAPGLPQEDVVVAAWRAVAAAAEEEEQEEEALVPQQGAAAAARGPADAAANAWRARGAPAPRAADDISEVFGLSFGDRSRGRKILMVFVLELVRLRTSQEGLVSCCFESSVVSTGSMEFQISGRLSGGACVCLVFGVEEEEEEEEPVLPLEPLHAHDARLSQQRRHFDIL